MPDEKLWYEKPIKVYPKDHSFRSLVQNGENGTVNFPFRHFWLNAAEQRAEIAKLWDIVHKARTFEEV